MDTPKNIKIAIIAALEREVKAAVKTWPIIERDHGGRHYKFFESDRAVVVCGGIGSASARRAAEAAIALYSPLVVASIGFAGALDSQLKVGSLFSPRQVIDARDGSSRDTGIGGGTLVTYSSVANVQQKAKLASAYGGMAVDMEAAGVAQAAEARGLRFIAMKSISDEHDFDIPEMDRFILNGRFHTGRFVLFAVCRPWLWSKLVQLAKNSSKAAYLLCNWLDQYNREGEIFGTNEPGLHLINRAGTRRV